MTKLQALAIAIEIVEDEVKNAMADEEVKQVQERLKVLQELEDDIIRFLNKEITSFDLDNRLRL